MIRPNPFSIVPTSRGHADGQENFGVTILAFYLALGLLAQAPAGSQDTADAGAVRLRFMRESLQGYELITSGEGGGPLKLDEKPVFRLGKQYADDLEDGAIFLWTAQSGRPYRGSSSSLCRTRPSPPSRRPSEPARCAL
jgi:hypothetical protein